MKDTTISVFRDLYKSKEVPYNMTLENVLNRIKTGKSKELIVKARNTKSKEDAWSSE